MEDKINILNELKEAGAVSLLNLDNKNYFFIPEGYFNNLASDILTHVFIKSLPSENPYTVSETYFTNLPNIILEKINFKHIPVLQAEEKNGYAVPDGYFNSLADNILKKIKSTALDSVQQELEQISPLLGSISRQNVYSVPDNYFNKLEALEIVEKKVKPAETKVISLSGRARKWINYAVAACISAVLFGGGYLYFFNNKREDTEISSLENINVQKELSGLSDEEIKNYLNENNNMAVYTNTGIDGEQQQNIDIQNLLQNVSDKEIQQYLNQDAAADAEEGI